MIIDDQTFKEQYDKINATKVKPVHWKFTAEFIDEDDKIIPAHNVTSIARISKYASAVSDYIFITLQVYKGNYFKLLAANRRLLRIRIIITPVSVVGTTPYVGLSYVENYDAYLTDNTSESVEMRSGQILGDQRDNLGELVSIDVHLVEKGLSEFRLWDIGGTYKNINMGRLIQALMSHPLKALGDSQEKGYNVTVYPPDNTEVYYQKLIPNGVHLIDLPGWIQDKWGVYATGLGYYLNQAMWYVYPLYDFTRYTKSKKRMTIINVPVNEMAGLSNSYIQEGDEIYVWATGDSKHVDTSDRLIDDSGTGFRAAKMGNLFDKFDVSAKGVTEIPKQRNVTPVTFETRKGKLDNIKPVGKLFSSNVWRDSSKVAANLGNIIILNWESSNYKLIYPGMPVKFLYKFEGTPYSLNGIILGGDTHISSPQDSVIDNRYKSNTTLTLFCERATK